MPEIAHDATTGNYNLDRFALFWVEDQTHNKNEDNNDNHAPVPFEYR